MSQSFNRMLLDEVGAGMVEYSLIIALVSIVAISALRTLGTPRINSASPKTLTRQRRVFVE